MFGVDPISRELANVHRTFRDDTRGEVATYIPELATVDPDQFGLVLVSLGGRAYGAGETDSLFTIQSVVKPFVYALALADLGVDAVLERVGVEPSGEAFNAISLEPGSGRPANPMINAGAILTVSLVQGDTPAGRFGRMMATLSAFAGRPLGLDQGTYHSELLTGDRNRALAYLMRNAGALTADVDETLEDYFRLCAVSVTAVDLAVMAATLANKGKNPVTGEHVVSADIASHVLTVMATCGMYDASGRWLVDVGLPAKSGVSGALVAASPGEFGVGIFSPRLDRYGNSVRAVAACAELSKRFELGLYRRPGRPAPAVYMSDFDEFPIGWTDENDWTHFVSVRPGRLAIRGLQGDISFADAEALLQSFDPLLRASGTITPENIVLELHRVGTTCRSATAILHGLVADLIRLGHRIAVVDRPDRELIPSVRVWPTLDAALGSLRAEEAGATPTRMEKEHGDIHE